MALPLATSALNNALVIPQWQARVPVYGVLWTGSDRTDPVVFYQVRTPESYHRLVHFLAEHPTWSWSFEWSRRRFLAYQRELDRKQVPWLMYRETPTGWRLTTPAPFPTTNPTSVAPTVIPLFSAKA
jgi:hypothetical protein